MPDNPIRIDSLAIPRPVTFDPAVQPLDLSSETIAGVAKQPKPLLWPYDTSAPASPHTPSLIVPKMEQSAPKLEPPSIGASFPSAAAQDKVERLFNKLQEPECSDQILLLLIMALLTNHRELLAEGASISHEQINKLCKQAKEIRKQINEAHAGNIDANKKLEVAGWIQSLLNIGSFVTFLVTTISAVSTGGTAALVPALLSTGSNALTHATAVASFFNLLIKQHYEKQKNDTERDLSVQSEKSRETERLRKQELKERFQKLLVKDVNEIWKLAASFLKNYRNAAKTAMGGS